MEKIGRWIWKQKEHIDWEQTADFLRIHCFKFLESQDYKYNTLVLTMIRICQYLNNNFLVEREFDTGKHCSYKYLTYYTTPFVLPSDITDEKDMDVPRVMD